jgi:hypothetical protein
MAIIACTNCGADTEHTAKFCRKCGSPVNLGEATTRSLDAQAALDEAKTRHVNVSPTTPSYIAPGMQMPPPAAPTQSFEKSRHKWAIITLASLVVILFLALAAVLITLSDNEPPAVDQPTSASEPPGLEAPIPPLPPLTPPPPGSRGTGPAAGTGLKYPGAENIGEVKRGSGVLVLRLKTDDPVDEVVKWYESKSGDKKVIKLPDGSTIISSGATSIIIKSESDGTKILITQAGLN